MLKGWLRSKVINRVYTLDPAGLPEDFQEYSPNPIQHFTDSKKLIDEKPEIDVLVMAVKPQIFESACEAIKPLLSESTLIVSIAAGKTIQEFQSFFSERQPTIRAMPNTPASIGKGITVLCSNSSVNETHKQTANLLLNSIGEAEWIDNEDLMDAVTAVSGSGPAYLFYFIEALTESATKAGLDKELAYKLAHKTITGAAALAEAQDYYSASDLREQVTSPAGTTEAALNILMNDELQTILDQAVDAALKRSKELSG